MSLHLMTRRRFASALGAISFVGMRIRADDSPVPVRGPASPGLEPFDEMMTEFLKKHDIPGGSLAVARHGKLVYAKGFGYADLEKQAVVRPGSMFRIASITKPITAVAILKYVEAGKIRLDTKVFEVLNLQTKVPPDAHLDPRWKEVTILHLLQHTGGWDRDKSFDPMFRQVDFAADLNAPPPATPDLIIRAMLDVPLDFDPGTNYAYSNFGYCLLGRVIETLSGKPYETAVKANVLSPLKISQMKIGRTRLAQQAPREVHYYTPPGEMANSVFPEDFGQPVLPPYGAWSLETLDAHGGWIASAADLVKFACAFDDNVRPTVLKRETIHTMFARPEGLAGHDPDGKPKDAYYALGWQVRPGRGRKANTWHTGSLDGTSTLLVRRFDGLDWAVLFNTRNTPTHIDPAGAIDPLVHQAADRVKKWPNTDHFRGLINDSRQPNAKRASP